MAYEKAINVGEHITKTNEMLQESFRGGRARFEAENAANQQEARRAAGRPTETYDEGVKATSEAERLDLDSQATNINGKGMQSGRMGLQDLKALASGTEVKYDGNANIGEKSSRSPRPTSTKTHGRHQRSRSGSMAHQAHTRHIRHQTVRLHLTRSRPRTTRNSHRTPQSVESHPRLRRKQPVCQVRARHQPPQQIPSPWPHGHHHARRHQNERQIQTTPRKTKWVGKSK